ncbi:MAG TPA: DUF2911 domain-containing protein [Cyclobacteriaceae bacterium]|nr:DUF2911 domain-containing protein [Cyclobacteriaceae bacterium]
MKKKIIIGVVAIVLILAAAIAYLNYRNYNLSPRGAAQLTSGDLSVSVTYSRPSVRGRVIFGTQDQGALQPYGVYWRLGANEATEITLNKDVTINGNSLKAGSYRFYAIPGPSEFEIIANSELGVWGVFEPDPSLDVMKTKIPVERIAPVEQFTISLTPTDGGININFEWSDVKLVVPVKG